MILKRCLHSKNLGKILIRSKVITVGRSKIMKRYLVTNSTEIIMHIPEIMVYHIIQRTKHVTPQCSEKAPWFHRTRRTDK
jgi:hypothetical protein